jgi:hypothetical protein
MHPVDGIDLETGGFRPLRTAPRLFKLPSCTVCKISFADPTSCSEVSSHTVLLQTADAGEVEVKVVQLHCNFCQSTVGGDAAEFGCVPGGSNQWYTQNLLDANRHMYESSQYKLSTAAIAAAHERSCSDRGGGVGGARARTAAGARAFRCITCSCIIRGQIYSSHNTACPTQDGRCPTANQRGRR